MTINVAIYARTSPDCPTSAEDQIERLKAVANAHGWTIVRSLSDHPMPIRKGKEKRPGQDALHDTIRRGEVQKVLLWSIDRFGRSLVELVGFLETCRTADAGLYLHDREMDTTTSNGVSLFDVSGLLALHVRQSRRDKILRGQAAARSASVRFGRPPIPVGRVEKAKELLATGTGVRQTARLAGISAASVSRLNASLRMSETVTA